MLAEQEVLLKWYGGFNDGENELCITRRNRLSAVVYKRCWFGLLSIGPSSNTRFISIEA